MPEDARGELVRLEEGGLDPDKFHHRDHVRIGFEMLRQRPFTEAVSRFASGLKAMARLKLGSRTFITRRSQWPSSP
jgi:hypothetical protein